MGSELLKMGDGYMSVLYSLFSTFQYVGNLPYFSPEDMLNPEVDLNYILSSHISTNLGN
jgi:hypothetical protein